MNPGAVLFPTMYELLIGMLKSSKYTCFIDSRLNGWRRRRRRRRKSKSKVGTLRVRQQVWSHFAQVRFDSKIITENQFKCRFDIALNDIEKWTNNLLPSRQFGKVVLTTSGGIMDHEEARRNYVFF